MRLNKACAERQKDAAAAAGPPAARARVPRSREALWLGLQQTHGNRFVQRALNGTVIQRKCACGGTCAACSSQGTLHDHSGEPVRFKLSVSQPGDIHEQEADRVADAVLRMPEQAGRAGSAVSGQVQDLLQTQKSPDRDVEAGLHAERMISTARGAGQPLPQSERAFFEPRFGYDFSQVRIHTDGPEAESARAVNARAYTVGRDVVFGAGEYAPETAAGKKLLAHELTHVVQQGAGGTQGPVAAMRTASSVVQRQPAPPPTHEDVWGLRITRSMCGCRQRVRDGIDWANTAAATYAACDIPANATSTDVEACFDAAHPTAVVAGSTSSSGAMTLPPPTADPCERIENKGTFVHETMHSRHTDDIARAQGAAFFREWRRLAGDPTRLDTLRVTFPAQVAAFESQWHDGHDWAQDEINSYRWERRFLVDALAALNRIC
jgi:hypothetical protein